MREVPDAIACEGCDALYTRPVLLRRQVARCLRCSTELTRHTGALTRQILPLVWASLLLYTIANAFPIVAIELRGGSNQTTLFGVVLALAAEGHWLVAMLVAATTLVFPLLHLLILAWLLTPPPRGRPQASAWLAGAMQSLRPWGMIEVFMLGVLVALVKLSSLATVLPGPALWAFVALTLLMTFVLSVDLRHAGPEAMAGRRPQP